MHGRLSHLNSPQHRNICHVNILFVIHVTIQMNLQLLRLYIANDSKQNYIYLLCKKQSGCVQKHIRYQQNERKYLKVGRLHVSYVFGPEASLQSYFLHFHRLWGDDTDFSICCDCRRRWSRNEMDDCLSLSAHTAATSERARRHVFGSP